MSGYRRVEMARCICDFVKSANAGQGKYLQRFYDQQNKLDQVYTVYSDARKVGDIEKAQELASGSVWFITTSGTTSNG